VRAKAAAIGRGYVPVLAGGASPAAFSATTGRLSGIRTRAPHWRQRTVLPRAAAGTERMARHFRFGQITLTTSDATFKPSLGYRRFALRHISLSAGRGGDLMRWEKANGKVGDRIGPRA
jgi:hypothetical protein